MFYTHVVIARLFFEHQHIWFQYISKKQRKAFVDKQVDDKGNDYPSRDARN